MNRAMKPLAQFAWSTEGRRFGLLWRNLVDLLIYFRV